MDCQRHHYQRLPVTLEYGLLLNIYALFVNIVKYAKTNYSSLFAICVKCSFCQENGNLTKYEKRAIEVQYRPNFSSRLPNLHSTLYASQPMRVIPPYTDDVEEGSMVS